jgi:hypothetical protein
LHHLSGGFSVPYQDIYARLTIPRLFGSPLRLELRPSYTWETINYYGLGNASSTQAPANSPAGYFSYERGHPQFDVDVRGKITDHLAGRGSRGTARRQRQAHAGRAVLVREIRQILMQAIDGACRHRVEITVRGAAPFHRQKHAAVQI